MHVAWSFSPIALIKYGRVNEQEYSTVVGYFRCPKIQANEQFYYNSNNTFTRHLRPVCCMNFPYPTIIALESG